MGTTYVSLKSANGILIVGVWFFFFSEDNVHGHFVRPDHYVVTWWCGDKNDVQSEETRGKNTLVYTGESNALTFSEN